MNILTKCSRNSKAHSPALPVPGAAARVAALVAAVLAGAHLQAQTTYDWNTNSDYYTNAEAWTPVGVPGVADTADIGNGGTALYTAPMTNALTSLVVGDLGNSGTVTMSGGELDITNTGTSAFIMGNASGSAGTFTQNGGFLTVARPSSGNQYYQDSFYPDFAAGSTGNFTLNNGTVYILCGMEAGIHGVGTLTVNGGTLVANGWFTFGRGASGTQTDGSGIFNLAGGTVYQLRNTGTGNDGLRLQQNATNGTANISGGALYTSGITFGLSGTGVAHPTATLTVSGGNLYIGYLGLSASTSKGQIISVNLSGGTFRTVDILNNFTLGTNEFLADGTNWTWKASSFPPINLTSSPGPGTVTFAPEAGRTITLNAPFTGLGTLAVAGPGTVVLGAVESYTGGTTVSGGTLAIAAAQSNALGLTLSSGTTLALDNNAALVESPLNIGSGVTLDFNAGNVIQLFTNNVTGVGNLLVTLGSSGQEVTTGTLGFSGSTLDQSGDLVVDGVLNASSGVLVTNTGILGGNGVVGTPITVNAGGAIEPGTLTAPGTLTVTNLTINNGGVLAVKLGHATTPGGGTNDLLVVASNLTLAANSVLSVGELTNLGTGTYLIATYSGHLNGVFGSLENLTGHTMALDYSTPGEIKLNVTGIAARLTWLGATNDVLAGDWDVGVTPNWFNGTNFTVFEQGDPVTFDDTASNFDVTLAASVAPSAISVNSTNDYNLSGGGQFTGFTGLTKSGSGTLALGGSSNDYTGPVQVNAGILQLDSASALGATNGGTTVAAGATLDLNGQNIGAEPLVVQGAGVGGTNGAIDNSSSTSPSQSRGLLDVTLAGNTTINASGARWDLGPMSLSAGLGSFIGNGYALTKLGPNDIWLHDLGDIGVGNIFVDQGRLGFQYTIGMGVPTDTLTVASGASLGLWQVTNVLSKPVVLTNGAGIYSSGGTGTSNVLAGAITLYGPTNNDINTAGHPLDLLGSIGGTGGFSKEGSGPLYLQGINTYTGETIVNSGGIVLGANAALGPSSPIELAAGAFVDASAPGGLTLGSGQTLAGFGSVAGNVTADGSAIDPGAVITPGTLTLSNNLTWDNTTNVIKLGTDPTTIGGGVNDLVSMGGNLTLNGTSVLVIQPIGLLAAGTPYTVMQYNGSLTGGAANLQVVSASPRYTVSLVDPASTPGSIEVTISGVGATLRWQGTATSNPGLWDHTTTNWLNLGTGNADAYVEGDSVIFDDTGSAKTVDIAATAAGAMTMSNNASAYAFTGDAPLGGTLDLEGTGVTTLADSNPPAFSGITANNGTLVFDVPGVQVYSNNAAISDANGEGGGIGGGLGTLVKAGTNTLVLNADDSLFTGTIVINNGVLQYTSTAGLGAPAGPLYATNNGTLDLHGVTSGPKNINIAGTGFDGQGAVNNTGGALVNQAGINYLNFVGDATIGSQSRWDIYDNIVNGNDYNVTKVGPGDVFFNGDRATGLGNIDITAGRIAFQGEVDMGDPSKSVTIETNAALTFYGVTNSSSVNGGEDKILVLRGDSNPTNGFAVFDSGGHSGWNNYFNGPVTLVGTNNIFGVRNDLTLWNGIGGTGGFIISGNYYAGRSHFTGSGTLYLYGTNTYTGPTIISNNAVVVETNSSLGDTSLIQVNSGATLDVSALTSFALGAGQTLIGAGTVNGVNTVFGSGSTLLAGFPNANIYTLTINGNLTLQSGSTNVVIVINGANDTVSGLTSVQMGGTLAVNNVGSPFVAGDTIKLFSATTYSGSFGNIIPATPGPNLAWDTSQLDQNGTLLVASTGVATTPTNLVFSVAGNQLTLSWPSNYTGWTLQVQTNALNVGLSTNWVDLPGSATTNKVTIPMNPANGTVFYRMILSNP